MGCSKSDYWIAAWWRGAKTSRASKMRLTWPCTRWCGALGEEEQECYSGQDFLLNLKRGDHVVYVNVPEWGKCTLAEVMNEYEWRFEDDDFNHRFVVDCKSVRTFDRNSDIVPAALSRRLKLQGRWWRVYVEAEFEALLASLRNGSPSATRTKETNVRELASRMHPLLEEMAGHIQHTHPAKDLEAFVEMVFRRVPGVRGVWRQQGKADRGADLLVEIEYGTIPGLVQTKTVVVQIKSYQGQHDDIGAVDDIRRAFEFHGSAEMGLIVSTARTAGPNLERAVENLQEEAGKPVSLLLGADLAAFVLRHAGGLLT